MAKCPAHQDRTASLSIRETDDGRVLINPFCGCDTGDVLDAVGLTFQDLFPERPEPEWRSPSRNPPIDLVGFKEATRSLLTGLCCLVADVASGRDVPDQDLQWAATEANRLLEILDMGGAQR
jgi:hypothetical protein